MEREQNTAESDAFRDIGHILRRRSSLSNCYKI
jgi:hypothetical protein